jgi:MYXO-CTERM domain-containing protein
MHVSKLVRGVGLVATVAAASLFLPARAEAQNCLSANPADWPPPAKPYFMIIQDTSGSMVQCTNPVTAFPNTCPSNATLNSCGMLPSRLNDAKCALRQVVQAFSGEVNFGLASFIPVISGCPSGTCNDDCVDTGGACPAGSGYFGEDYTCSYSDFAGGSCGSLPACPGAGPAAPNLPEGTWRNGGRILVPMKQDSATAVDNTAELLQWFDGSCNNSRELFAKGGTPLAGSLESVTQYLRAGWTAWTDNNYCSSGLSYTYPTPLTATDPGCRSVNIILVTDGDEACDDFSFTVAAAADLHDNGVTIGGTNWPVNVYVINFAGGVQANTDQIAAAGGTGASLFAANEVELAQSLSSIIAGAVAPEVCNNGDDNCNGCVDEGYNHYCNTGQTCCNWSTQAQRTTCLSNYTATITPADPDGNLALLPCTTQAQANNSSTWLCYNPGDPCDNADNNCSAGIDEGAIKCGMPAHCPLAETCNTQDDDCDGLTDEGGVCGTCTPTPEVCDGCDNDCDGTVDEGIAPISCGLPSPANCAGTKACLLSGQSVTPGGCLSGGGFGPCTNNPGNEVCDGIDNDCDGLADDGIPPVPCGPAGLNYGPNSQCQQGLQACGGLCIGAVGPGTEICDGIDNDCDFQVDEPNLPGVGQPCGISTPPCSPGVTACVNGAIVCSGGVQPTGEQCDGVDNNCNGFTDEAPLVDAPLPGQTGCWNLAGNCCAHDNLSWCPPPGAGCFDAGSLQQPCSAGTLSCAGAQGWVCLGGTPPSGEVCDGVDNDCDGTPDDGSFPGEGQTCGLNAPQTPVPAGCTPGDCQTGVIDCQNGFLDCVGDVPPVNEICNGKDDNCDGTCDNGIPVGAECDPVYDTAQYPDTDPSLFPCQPGHLECDGLGGLICVGALGPNPEICDGNDNDCDGSTDEPGPQPNGIDGTADPNDPTHVLGGTCPEDMTNVCTPGMYACTNGLVQCVGIGAGEFEACDCQDNDCNGVTDNQNPNNMPPLCSPGKSCVNFGGSCQCAQPCTGEDFCPGGQICKEVESSETGRPLGKFCVTDYCGDCETKTVTDANQNVVCAPAGTVLEDCFEPPVCECKGQNGCQAPCFGVTCTAPDVCSNYGPNAGECVANNCFNVPCPGCGMACNDDGVCVTNPCTDTSCPPDQMCQPSDDFLSFECLPSCAGVVCPDGQECHEGMCVPTCVPECPMGEVCDLTQVPPTCVTNLCPEPFCTDGSCCDPITGACGACPCEGVICPDGQTCQDGECILETGEGGGGTTSATTGSGTGAGNGAGGSGSGEGAADANGVWGLATGGGGCSCNTTDTRSDSGFVLAGLGLAIVGLRRRRRSKAGAPRGEVAR